MPTQTHRAPVQIALVTSALASVLAAYACGSSDESTFGDGNGTVDGSVDGSGDGPAFEDDDGSFGDDPDAATGPIVLTIRDFRPWQEGTAGRSPDFQKDYGIEAPERFEIFEKPDDPTSSRFVEPTDGDNSGLSIVLPDLGTDGKPVYNVEAALSTGLTFGSEPRTPTTHGKTYFDMWYHDTPEYNTTLTRTLTLSNLGNGLVGYDSLVSGIPYSDGGEGTEPIGTARQFFPIENDGFGNSGTDPDHNYHFTTELHTEFTYAGGERFTFTGDDDVFVFINQKVVINMGGVRYRGKQTVVLDDVRERIGLAVGGTYPLDLFSAERSSPESNVRFETNLRLRPGRVR